MANLGQPIPDTAHAISVSLPSWRANVGYEEGEEWVLGKMQNGYPRFFVHHSIRAFAEALVARHGKVGEEAMLFPSTCVASRCLDFMIMHASLRSGPLSQPTESNGKDIRLMDLVLCRSDVLTNGVERRTTMISAVLFPKSSASLAAEFWQHSGEGISSRRAEFFYKAFSEGHLVPRPDDDQDLVAVRSTLKGPRRYRKLADGSHSTTNIRTAEDPHYCSSALDNAEYVQFIEERFGRNLDLSFATSAKLAIRRRIAGSLKANTDLNEALDLSNDTILFRHGKHFSEDDVYLYPTGMSSIFNTHRILRTARGPMKSIMFGFPYIDTLKILEKFGPGCVFYGHGSSAELDHLETRCSQGEKFLALFCEFPGNPLLKTPDLQRIRKLADDFDFAVVVDETIGNFLNVDVFPLSDVVVSSLTKVFSGDSNVMGGSCVLNPSGRYYDLLHGSLSRDFEDNYWPEDAVFMERNSRDFISRNNRINRNAEAVCEILRKSSQIKTVYYPLFSPTRFLFEAFRTPKGGYGGLFSITFYSAAQAATFFDCLDTAKGPSLGTNFTLSSPFVILAHYKELDWAAQFGADANLVRVSVGLEDTNELSKVFEKALATLKECATS